MDFGSEESAAGSEPTEKRHTGRSSMNKLYKSLFRVIISQLLKRGKSETGLLRLLCKRKSGMLN